MGLKEVISGDNDVQEVPSLQLLYLLSIQLVVLFSVCVLNICDTMGVRYSQVVLH